MGLRAPIEQTDAMISARPGSMAHESEARYVHDRPVHLLARCSVPSGASGASAAQRIDLKVLLLGADRTRTVVPGVAGAAETRGRVLRPARRDARAMRRSPRATLSQTLADGAGGEVPGRDRRDRRPAALRRKGCASSLSAEEWAALQAYEQTFHVRQLTAYIFPGPTTGSTRRPSSGPLEGHDATLTAAGQRGSRTSQGDRHDRRGDLRLRSHAARPGRPSRRSSRARAAPRCSASSRIRTAARRWSRRSTATSSSSTRSCCATASSRG